MDDFKNNVDSNAPHESAQDPQKSQMQESVELNACKNERDAYKEKYLRVQADYDNFTKRVDKERINWRTTAQAAILLDVLAIVDDFDRAASEHPANTASDFKKQLEGFALIHKALHKLVDKYEVKEIDPLMPFDPHYHEAIMQTQSPNHQHGEIVAILQKGYTHKGQVLRPAKVSVAQ